MRPILYSFSPHEIANILYVSDNWKGKIVYKTDIGNWNFKLEFIFNSKRLRKNVSIKNILALISRTISFNILLILISKNETP